MIDLSKLKRNPALYSTVLNDTGKSQLVAKVPCQVIFPSRYFQAGLGNLSSLVEIVAIFALVTDKEYTVCKAIAIMPFTPDKVAKQVIDEVEYTILEFDKGAVVCPNTQLVRSDTLLYYIDSEFYKKGKFPVFIDPMEDVPTLFQTLEYYTGVTATYNNRPWELITANIVRNPDNIRQYFRHMKKGSKDVVYVPLESVAFTAVSTTSKITGAYLDEGLLSSALYKSTEISKVEEVLRS